MRPLKEHLAAYRRQKGRAELEYHAAICIRNGMVDKDGHGLGCQHPKERRGDTAEQRQEQVPATTAQTESKQGHPAVTIMWQRPIQRIRFSGEGGGQARLHGCMGPLERIKEHIAGGRDREQGHGAMIGLRIGQQWSPVAAPPVASEPHTPQPEMRRPRNRRQGLGSSGEVRRDGRGTYREPQGLAHGAGRDQ